MSPSSNIEKAQKHIAALTGSIEAFIYGQKSLITEALCAFLSGGHILLTGAPGLAKTSLVRVFSQFLGLSFGRIQFTPDLLPSDIVGSDILNVDELSGKRAFQFSKGPVFVNLLLADEINRASPRTQSALLEAMQERTVTVAGKAYELSHPFMVFATQNPYESEGTFALPEAQLDRFLIHSLVSYPDKETEKAILSAHAKNHLIGEQTSKKTSSEPLLAHEEICFLLDAAKSIDIPQELIGLIAHLIRSTRPEDIDCPEDIKKLILYGAGPRAGIALISASRAFALIEGQSSVSYRHIKRMALPCLRHRIRVSAYALRDRLDADHVINQILEKMEKHYTHLIKGNL